ncbi:MAG: D-alanyl-D-alanine carboxypeptidase family protein [Myxococcales bacterium]|nr:D-alanyl-D-alanine carboxypeptidase family protein [Myxococcales bacterium]
MTQRGRRGVLVAVCLWVTWATAGFAPSHAHAQSVNDLAAKRACTTSGLEGLTGQLVELHLCMFPEQVVEAANPNIVPTAARVNLLFTAETLAALNQAAASLQLQVNSAFRSLADQFVLYHSGACGAAALPGRSNHQSGLAVDLANWSAALGAMTAAGCKHPLPNTDAVHFDCPGPDMRSASVLVFQRLWNANNPADPISEDGSYGPQTADRVGRSPAGGFASNGCDTVGMNMTGAEWAAGVVAAAPSLDIAFTMARGETRDVTIELSNSGSATWDGSVKLVTSAPRGRESAFRGNDWLSTTEVAAVEASVTTGGNHRFEFTITAPDVPGHYDEHFTLRQGDATWFGDAGGPADEVLHFSIDVTEQRAARTSNADGGCSVGQTGDAPWASILGIAGLLAVRGRRRRFAGCSTGGREKL